MISFPNFQTKFIPPNPWIPYTLYFLPIVSMYGSLYLRFFFLDIYTLEGPVSLDLSDLVSPLLYQTLLQLLQSKKKKITSSYSNLQNPSPQPKYHRTSGRFFTWHSFPLVLRQRFEVNSFILNIILPSPPLFFFTLLNSKRSILNSTHKFLNSNSKKKRYSYGDFRLIGG